MGLLGRFTSILGARVAIISVGLVTTPLFTRLLGSSLYGEYAVLLSILGITMIIVNAGIFDGLRKFIAEDRDDDCWKAHVFGFYLRIAVLFAVIAVGIYTIIILTGLPTQIFGEKFSVYFSFLGIIIVLRQSNSVGRGGLMGLGLERLSEPLSILRHVVFAIIGVTLAYQGHGVIGILAAHIIASFVVSILGLLLLSREINTEKALRRVPKDFPYWNLLTFNTLSVVLILLTSSLYHIDILLLQPLTSSQTTGYYRAALVVAEFLWLIPTALQTTLLHSSSELWANNATEEITTIASKATRHNLSLVLLFSIGLAALAEEFVPLYFGMEFSESVVPLLLLLPGAIGFAIARPIFAVGQGKGDLPILIAATGIAAAANLFLNLLLIPQYGMIGAALATTTGYGLMVVFHVIAARRIGFNPLVDLRLKSIGVTASITSVVVFGSESLITSPILSLIIVPPIGFITYMACSIRTEAITSEEIEVIKRELPPVLQRVLSTIVEFIIP